jgi:hypothetical protein
MRSHGICQNDAYSKIESKGSEKIPMIFFIDFTVKIGIVLYGKYGGLK